jgi:TonB family protein
VTDEIGQELDRRWAEPWPWRSSLGVALGLHLAVVVAALVGPSLHRRPLTLPSVRVRLGVVAPAPVPATGQPPVSQPRPAAPPPLPAPRPAPKSPKTAAPPGRQPKPAARAALPAPTEAAPVPDPASDGANEPGRGGAGETRSASGTLGLSSGSDGGGPSFPYAYYLTRLLGLIESNWFRPPSPAGTRCRVLCRIDRSGRLLDTGIEESSGIPAFDRAALRAVYSSAPLPPLPQGWVGSTLTLHLEFGP